MSKYPKVGGGPPAPTWADRLAAMTPEEREAELARTREHFARLAAETAAKRLAKEEKS
jgi:hypothetical protein